MADDSDIRNEVTIYKHKTGMYDKSETTITLKSKDETIDNLLEKAKKCFDTGWDESLPDKEKSNG